MTRVDLPWAVPPLTGNRVRGNPIAQGRKVSQALQEARWAVRAAKPNLWPIPVEVSLHYRPRTRLLRDADGMAPTFKVCQDALVQEGVLEGDDWRYVRRAVQEIHEPTGEPAAMWVTVRPWRAA